MTNETSEREAFAGIDVACAKGKLLPICVLVRSRENRLEPVSLRDRRAHPATRGNRTVLDPQWRRACAEDVVSFLRKLETDEGLRLHRVAIDAPRSPAGPGKRRRACEEALGREGLSFISTPTADAFSRLISRAKDHYATAGAPASVPGANLLWMLLGFSLFEALGEQFDCLETYPYAIIRRLGCVLHKTTVQGYRAQLAAAAQATGWLPVDLERRLAQTTSGTAHDRLDAFMCAWIASLSKSDREAYGEPPHDAIWVSRHALLAELAPPSTALAPSVPATRSQGMRFSCPICGKEFAQGRAGWDAHVGSAATHKGWHPDVRDAEERKRLFRAEYPGFFGTAHNQRSIDNAAHAGQVTRTSIDQLTADVAAFVEERDWRQFHSPRNLAAALAVEAAEILEHFQWLTNKQSRALSAGTLESVRDEIGDVLIYLVRLADELGVDVLEAAARKLEKNRRRYPAERVRGDARKYDEY